MQGKVKRFRWVAIVGLALLVVPIAQAKPVTFSKLQQGETAQGLKADGMRLQAEAKAYLRSQGSSSSAATGYKYGGDVMGAQVHYPFATSAAATGYRYSGDVMGVQVHYPFANENTAAFKAAEQKANASPAPISENSPVEQRLETQSPSSAPISENSPVEQQINQSSPVPVASSGRGFDYGDAGIGAGLAALLTSILALGAGTRISRKRVAHV